MTKISQTNKVKRLTSEFRDTVAGLLDMLDDNLMVALCDHEYGEWFRFESSVFHLSHEFRVCNICKHRETRLDNPITNKTLHDLKPEDEK